MEQMLKKYVKRFLRDQPTDKYYEDKDFHVGISRGAAGASGEKKYRPKRAASSRAMETVSRALRDGGQEEVGGRENLTLSHSCNLLVLAPIRQNKL